MTDDVFEFAQARKRRININFLVRLVLGRPQVPGTNPVCPWEKPRFFPYFTQWKPGVSLGQTQFVPGTNPVCPWDKPGVEGRHKKLICVKSLWPFPLAISYKAPPPIAKRNDHLVTRLQEAFSLKLSSSSPWLRFPMVASQAAWHRVGKRAETQKWETLAEKQKMAHGPTWGNDGPNMAKKLDLGSFFLHFWAPFSIFRPIFPHFRISARFPFYARRPDSQPQGHKGSVTTLGKSHGPPQTPAEPHGDPAETLEETRAYAPENPLRGKFPRRASRRVVPLEWRPSGTLKSLA